MKPPASRTDSIALLIDADNASATKTAFIITELEKQGTVNIRRAYGNWKKPNLAPWEKVLHEHAIQPVQQFDLSKGKNAADMALLIDAMDILYTKDVGTFCLVSSDCDFTPLSLRLRADGKQVIGFGDKDTPEPFVKSCTRFVSLEETARKVNGNGSAPKKAAAVNHLKENTKLMDLLRSAVEASKKKDGWATLGEVGSHIMKQGPFKSGTYGFSTLSGLFAAIDTFEVNRGATGKAPPVVRIKPQ